MKLLILTALIGSLIMMSSAVFKVTKRTVDYRQTEGKFSAPTQDELIEQVADHFGLPVLLLTALVQHESRHNPKVSRKENHLAQKFGKGAEASSYGLSQVVYGFHKERCGLSSPQDLEDPLTNLLCGASYLKLQIEKNGKRVRVGLRRFNGLTKTNVTYPDRVYKEAAALIGSTPAIAEKLIQSAYDRSI